MVESFLFKLFEISFNFLYFSFNLTAVIIFVGSLECAKFLLLLFWIRRFETVFAFSLFEFGCLITFFLYFFHRLSDPFQTNIAASPRILNINIVRERIRSFWFSLKHCLNFHNNRCRQKRLTSCSIHFFPSKPSFKILFTSADSNDIPFL